MSLDSRHSLMQSPSPFRVQRYDPSRADHRRRCGHGTWIGAFAAFGVATVLGPSRRIPLSPFVKQTLEERILRVFGAPNNRSQIVRLGISASPRLHRWGRIDPDPLRRHGFRSIKTRRPTPGPHLLIFTIITARYFAQLAGKYVVDCGPKLDQQLAKQISGTSAPLRPWRGGFKTTPASLFCVLSGSGADLIRMIDRNRHAARKRTNRLRRK